MSVLDELAKAYGSRRYARDLLERTDEVVTKPWWPFPSRQLSAEECARRAMEAQVYPHLLDDMSLGLRR